MRRAFGLPQSGALGAGDGCRRAGPESVASSAFVGMSAATTAATRPTAAPISIAARMPLLGGEGHGRRPADLGEGGQR
ncbi:hypothetical protein, partial [Streptomyces sp. CS159]|uniref:hypothetical protein n=1 Tax=Streptomyces sp. CS159 TaxID=1982762 RepID=UPI001C52DBB2